MFPNFDIYVGGRVLAKTIKENISRVRVGFGDNIMTIIEIETKNPDLAIEFDTIFPPGDEVDVYMGWGQELEYMASGLVITHESETYGEESTAYTIICYDKLWLLSRNFSARSWRNVTYSEMIETVATHYNFQLDVEPTTYKHNFTKKKGESDFDFISKMADVINYMFWTEKDPRTRSWIFNFKRTYPVQDKKYMFRRTRGDLIKTAVENLIMHEEIQDIQVLSYNFQNGTWGMESERKDDLVFTAPSDYRVADIRGQSLIRIGVGDYGFDVVSNGIFMAPEDLVNFARRWIRERRDNFILLTEAQVVGFPNIRPKQVHYFDLSYKNKPQYSGDYYISSVDHEINVDEGYFISMKGRKIIDEGINSGVA